ncbi:hypothetical protein QVN76_05240 [Yersinia rochesterensis]|nr:hypothetical protein [Yersinia rochesterensis]MDN0106293.1 hypothetical protein [Yersinia rochesterensis]
MSDILEWENLYFPSRVALKSRSEKSFLNFTLIWFELLQSDRLLVNWHHKMMAAKLDDLVNNLRARQVRLWPHHVCCWF